MGVSSGRSRVADLAFLVFGRTLHPDWFHVHAATRAVQTGWEADLRIVEGGHAIHWACGPWRLTEVLAGQEATLPEPGLLFHSPVRHERTVTLRPGPTVEYQTCFEAERVDPEVFYHLSEELTLDARRGGLFHRFARANRMAPAPLSHLAFESRTGGLAVQSVHTFPDELAIVRTQSLFEVRP
jgi:hypothetical protein